MDTPTESANRNVCLLTLGDITDGQLENISKEHCYSRGLKRKYLELHDDVDGQQEHNQSLSPDDCFDDNYDACQSEIESEKDEDEEEEEGPLGGRRIVELSVLAAKLGEGCSNCSTELKLSSCVGETRYGLGSLLKIHCNNCNEINNVPTGKRHGQNTWDINTKLGAAVVFCGLGEMTVNNFLAALNIPTVTSVTFKRREREVGSIFEAVANETCNEALAEEKKRSQDAEKFSVSFDAGWQTRGSGRNYASLSGHASMIGEKTGKILSYAVRCKKCRFCDKAPVSAEVNKHDCRRNWEKSSKAMEPDMALEMLHDLKARDFHVKHLIMDNDSTTLAKAKMSFDPNIQKISDFNHTKKNLASKLYDIKKEKKYPLLGPKSIQHLLKCFSYAVKSNEDTDTLKRNLDSIPLHVFGNHKKCEKKWCKYLQDPENYKPINLPYGKYLSGVDLLKDLQHLFSDLAKNASKLSNIGSTQANENFNKIVACKNPKALYYSGSESTSFRVAAAVAHKNIGHLTIGKVYDTLMLSPGMHTNVHERRVSRKREKEKLRQSTVECKRRRHELKKLKSSQISTSEIKEGKTYESGVGLSCADAVIEEIPDCTPASKPVSVPTHTDSNLLYFDLETTGLGTSAEITQLACIFEEETFNRF